MAHGPCSTMWGVGWDLDTPRLMFFSEEEVRIVCCTFGIHNQRSYWVLTHPCTISTGTQHPRNHQTLTSSVTSIQFLESNPSLENKGGNLGFHTNFHLTQHLSGARGFREIIGRLQDLIQLLCVAQWFGVWIFVRWRDHWTWHQIRLIHLLEELILSLTQRVWCSSSVTPHLKKQKQKLSCNKLFLINHNGCPDTFVNSLPTQPLW